MDFQHLMSHTITHIKILNEKMAFQWQRQKCHQQMKILA